MTFIRDCHLTDETLLLLDEDELSRHASDRAAYHLADCPACRQRLDRLRQTEQDVRSPALPERGLEAARTRLQAGLRSASQGLRPGVWQAGRAALLRPANLLRVCAVVALLMLAVTYRQAGLPLQDLMTPYEETGPRPDHALTPGSASALTVEQVCRLSDDDLDPSVPREMRRAVFRAYRMDERTAKAYQVDYLINPQLGGDSSLQNLWPEPYHATVWNATAKDALETRLHAMVCNGQIDLRAAQQELSNDWIAAYKKYFHASRPVRTVAAVEAASTN